MSFMLMKASQGLASLIILGAVGFGIYKLGQVLIKGVIANSNKGEKK